jgi:hypothetical protein
MCESKRIMDKVNTLIIIIIINGSAAILLGLDRFLNLLILCIVPWTPWMEDQSLARPLLIQGTTQTE